MQKKYFHLTEKKKEIKSGLKNYRKQAMRPGKVGMTKKFNI